jgi:hypothetical protein
MRLSLELQALEKKWAGRSISIQQLMEEARGKGQIFLTLVLSVPFLLFIPIPGLSTLFGVVIFLCGISFMRQKPTWLPHRWMCFKIKEKHWQKVIKGGIWLGRKLENCVRSRLPGIYHLPWGPRFLGICIAICGFLLALPLPPGTNFLPALTLIFFSIGFLEGDGLLGYLGYLLFALDLFLYIVLPTWQLLKWL